MRLEFYAFNLADGVKHRANRTLRNQFGVELLERAGGCIARVGKSFFALGGELGIERVEILDGNVSLAAHFEQRRGIFAIQLQRNAAHGFEIRRDVIAFRAVAARDAEIKFAVPVMTAERNAVHLRLDDVLHLIAAEMLADGRVEGA